MNRTSERLFCWKANGANVIPLGDAGEPLGEDGAAVLVSLAESDVPPSGAGESEVHASDS